MTPIRVAVLEDNEIFLKELIDNLKRTELVTIVAYEKSSEPFIKQVREKQPEALLLDIHLKDETINGVQVAEILKLPVLFLSAERKNHLESIDNLKLLGTFPVEEVGKTPDTDKLKTILRTFIPRIKEYQKTQKVKIKPKGEDEMYINPSDVVFIKAMKGAGDHKLNFVTREPLIVADKNFDYFKTNGFTEDKFYLFLRSFLFNRLIAYYENNFLKAKFMNEQGRQELFEVEVPPNKRKEVKNRFLK